MAMWKCLPILLLSPLISIFVHGWDLLIYMLVLYSFTAVLIWTFRQLCHEWTDWHLKVPALKEKDLVAWYETSEAKQDSDDEAASDVSAARAALLAQLRELAENKRITSLASWRYQPDPFVKKIAEGLPYAAWLLKDGNESSTAPLFSMPWLVQLGVALNSQRHLMRGLREHSSFINYRYSRHDVSVLLGVVRVSDC